jgi:hypothetical protein
MRRLATLALVATLGATACGDGGGAAAPATSPPTTAPPATSTTAPATCTEVRERLDPASAQHLLPGAPEPRYLTDPPTSGAHAVGTLPTGALDAPIPRPVQVAILEAGGVIVQYAGLPPADIERLRALAGGDVRVAPADRLPAPVVATAWTWKLTCSAVDPAALQRFVAAHAGKGA